MVKSDIDDRYARSWVVTHDGRRARCFTAPTLEAFRQRMGPLLGKFHVGALYCYGGREGLQGVGGGTDLGGWADINRWICPDAVL